jgi:hypothetical protein
MGGRIYDDEGALIWRELAESDPDYYPSRAAEALVRSHMERLRRQVPPNLLMIGLGAGAERALRLDIEVARSIMSREGSHQFAGNGVRGNCRPHRVAFRLLSPSRE